MRLDEHDGYVVLVRQQPLPVARRRDLRLRVDHAQVADGSAAFPARVEGQVHRPLQCICGAGAIQTMPRAGLIAPYCTTACARFTSTSAS